MPAFDIVSEVNHVEIRNAADLERLVAGIAGRATPARGDSSLRLFAPGVCVRARL